MNRRLMIMMLVLLIGLLLTACGGGDSAAGGDAEADTAVVFTGDPAAGEELYGQVCIACHGPGGAGVEGLGKPFTTSEFLQSNTEAELLAFVKTGRPISDPANTTGVDMPPKGGNPALTDEQILDIIAYIQTLNE